MRKGQAALEFLTTYGWAFLVILVMIGALAYFGVLDPQKYLPEKCVLTTGLDCVDFQVTSSQARIKITNNLGSSLTSVVVAAYNTSNNGGVTCGSSSSMNTGETKEFTCAITTNIGTGNKVKYKINVNYTKAGSTYQKSAYGELFATVN